MKPGTIYSLHPGFAMESSSMRLLKERSGKTLDEWVEIVSREGPDGAKNRQAWLKAEHGFTSSYALWVAGRSCGELGSDAYDPDAEVEKQYSGKKQALRPIYDELLRLGLGLGPDVKACPCGTMVPLYRKNVFAQIKASTNSRVDLGLCLRGVPGEGRLIETGGEAKGDRITHRIAIFSIGEMDEEAVGWLRRAYRAAG